MKKELADKLKVLADAAKYDVSCSSSGSRRNSGKGVGSTRSAGVCHSFTEDGRCISLFKILLTNRCIYDCAYCVNRCSNGVERASFEVDELVELTMGFYRRNYIEGLFLSSGVEKSPDHTMERLVCVARKLRNEQNFNGYIHLKAIPGADPVLIQQAGLLADRISVNIEIPSEPQLKLLAPQKDHQSVFRPMDQIHGHLLESREEKKKSRRAPRFAPAGQTTQLIVGASPETDLSILQLASGLYEKQGLKRVYYSGFVPVNAHDARLPALTAPPLLREHRLYQADWLMRFYQFEFHEILSGEHSQLDLQMDPKLAYALRNPHLFPIDLNNAPYEMILRVPGIGVRSAKIIVANRRFGRIGFEHLKRMGVALKRAKFFIQCRELPAWHKALSPEQIKMQLLSPGRKDAAQLQLPLFE